jgi:hypothetical protein
MIMKEAEGRRNNWERIQTRMALRKGKIVEAAGVQRSGGAGEKEKILGIASTDDET